MKFVLFLMMVGLVAPFLVPAPSVGADSPTQVVEKLRRGRIMVGSLGGPPSPYFLAFRERRLVPVRTNGEQRWNLF
jgi:hypothetical protein